MKKSTRRNILISPIVLLIRLPILVPFWLLARIGERAETIGEWLSYYLPGFGED